MDLENRGAKKSAIANNTVRSSVFALELAGSVSLTLSRGKVQALQRGTGLASCREW